MTTTTFFALLTTVLSLPLLVSAGSDSTMPITNANTTLVNGKTYSISPAAFPSLCVVPSSSAEGAGLIVADCDSHPDIVWTSDGKQLHNAATEFCADVTDGETQSGALVQVWGCYDSNPNQVYTISGGSIRWTGGGNMCLDLTDGQGVQGTKIQTWSCFEGNSNQQWRFDEVQEVEDQCPDGDDANLSYCDDMDGQPTATVSASASASASASITAASSASSAPGGELIAGDGNNSGTSHGHPHKSSSASDSWSASTTDSWASATGGSGVVGIGISVTVSAGQPSQSAGSGGSGSGDMSGYLQVSGTKIVDPSGNEVLLRGTNLGGWLVWEDWMCGISDNSGNADRFPRTTLEQRFGEDQLYELWNVWQDNWLVASDFATLASMNFNVVRLPFDYRNFVKSDGSFITGSDGNVDFSRLDWAVAQAKKNSIYVIPVYHIWDGQEQSYSTISEDSSDGQDQRDKAAELWTKMAAHFVGESAVAGFDMMNEVTGSADNNVQRDMYNAIRQGDPKRIVIMESISSAPDGSWTNVVYSMHEYLMMGDDQGYNQQVFEQGVRSDTNTYTGEGVPTYIGEFMASDGTLTWMLQQMNDMKVSWSGWTWKTVNMDRWGLVNFGPDMSVSVSDDDYDTIKNKWSNMGGTTNSRVYDQYASGAAGNGGGNNDKREESIEARTESEQRTVVYSPRAGQHLERQATGGHGGRSRRMTHGRRLSSF